MCKLCEIVLELVGSSYYILVTVVELKMASRVGTLDEFDPSRETVTNYVERAQIYFEANDIVEAKKVSPLRVQLARTRLRCDGTWCRRTTRRTRLWTI